ncbi:MAG TPA: hypothetical protein VKZ63_13950, partial [Kofleriaceae bacterium]|nr:hypothetical protein [Kofleriaceae bacterium]
MSIDAVAHRAEVEAWRARREARYRSPTGWLSLVDRIPLDEGTNATPIGALVVDGASVRLRVAGGAPVTRGGQ